MADPSHAPIERSPWFPWAIRVAWIFVYLHCMAQAGWNFTGASGELGGDLGSILGFGFPGPAILNLHGAAVPFLVEAGDWHRLLLDPFIESTLIGLVFTLLIWSGLGVLLYQIVGASRSWIIFILGGAAAALSLVWFHPNDIMGGAGPQGTIYAAMGALATFGFTSSSPIAQIARRRALSYAFWIALFTVVFAFAQGGMGNIRWAPVVASLLTGGGAIAAFGFSDAEKDPGILTRAVALVLFAFVVVAVIQQAPRATEGAERIQRVQEFKNRVIAMERAAYVVRDPFRANADNRQELANAINRVMATLWTREWEGYVSLQEWIACFEPYTDPNSEALYDPHAHRLRIRQAWESYLPYEQALLREVGVRPREDTVWVPRY